MSGGLSLNNNGDTVTLRSSDNAIIDSVTYPAACVRCTSSIGTSINRQTDLNRNTLFVGRDLVTGAVGKCSPGARANGMPFSANDVPLSACPVAPRDRDPVAPLRSCFALHRGLRRRSGVLHGLEPSAAHRPAYARQ